ncbi:anaphase-promoting complex subunit 15 isoform X2 [Octopus bimaculoides]|uniref:Anaphase-promoting complex subunit 15 n=1 Tax=Octopus bimaculoides TaxID=37653 RepID=A0A0L8H1E2_OCTBM|nr:anaphase-promoting complex subunit 15 isoform X2 [Octopus bimaculoides]|eukprot:XP_014776202.1 PREDICTED: anaphase-promoting complex subunit 15-like isoform X2 [Octopus bimaculoides]
MFRPLFPALVPKAVDPFWFPVDKPCLDESEISALEADYNNWAQSVGDKDNAIVPIGKTAQEHYDEEEEEEEEEEVDDESDTNDDELDTDMVDDRDSADDFDFRGRRNSLNLIYLERSLRVNTAVIEG